MKSSDILETKDAAIAAIKSAPDSDTLDKLRVKYLGRKGILQDIMQSLKDCPPADRPRIGKSVNEMKQAVQSAHGNRKKELEQIMSDSNAAGIFDTSRPGEWRDLGSCHPLTSITGRITDIFRSLGFTVAEGPDVETVHNNFDALNTPENHPSRDIQDTFYLNDGDLLRCHTSPVQVRYMESHSPPVRIIAPGRCYRRDTPDATHSANFHQVEGLYVDKEVSLAELKGTIAYFAKELMGDSIDVRFRPHFFPFTEPSVEVDFTCHVCNGKGCRVCKHSGWIEIMGAGMVDPNVFAAVGYSNVTGFAFGMGVERLAMIMYGIPDIRILYENDDRFLSQF